MSQIVAGFTRHMLKKITQSNDFEKEKSDCIIDRWGKDSEIRIPTCIRGVIYPYIDNSESIYKKISELYKKFDNKELRNDLKEIKIQEENILDIYQGKIRAKYVKTSFMFHRNGKDLKEEEVFSYFEVKITKDKSASAYTMCVKERGYRKIQESEDRGRLEPEDKNHGSLTITKNGNGTYTMQNTLTTFLNKE